MKYPGRRSTTRVNKYWRDAEWQEHKVTETNQSKIDTQGELEEKRIRRWNGECV